MRGKAPWSEVKKEMQGKHQVLPQWSERKSKHSVRGYPVTGYFPSPSLSFTGICQRTLSKARGPAMYRSVKATPAPELYVIFIKGTGDN